MRLVTRRSQGAEHMSINAYSIFEGKFLGMRSLWKPKMIYIFILVNLTIICQRRMLYSVESDRKIIMNDK
jgi:hypothetical protein